MLKTPSGICLRKWQDECLSVLTNKINTGRRHFTVVATMGSGKTFLQGAFAHYLLENNLVDKVINLVPSDSLRTNNTKELEEHFNIKLSTKRPGQEELADGFATTYHMLTRDFNVKQLIEHTVSEGQRFLLLADEVHHGSSKEKSPWGQGLQTLVDASTYSLMLSGTMWRSDNLRIAGVNYIETTPGKYEVVPDFAYSLKQATNDQVVSNVFFNELSAEVKINTILDERFDVGDRAVKFNRRIVNKQAERSFKHLVNPKGEFCQSLLTEAHTALSGMVQRHEAKHPDVLPPAGLIVASTREAADEIAVLMETITGEQPVVVHSGIPNSKDLIQRFASGELDNPWMVSVGMVSEGVDVPRIKVLAYLTTARTELVFHQIIGRAMRVRKAPCGSDVEEQAMVYIPATPRLHGHVSNFIKDQTLLALEEPKKKKRKPRKERTTLKERTVFLQSRPVGPIEMFVNGMLVNYEQVFKQLEVTFVNAMDALKKTTYSTTN